MNRKRCIGMALVVGLFSFSVVEAEDLRFRVKIENTSGGSALPGPFAPGVWVTHADPGVLFVDGIPDPGGGLEALAEDGDASALAETVAASPAAFASGVFAVPSGSDGAGPLFPGQAYEFTVLANPSNPYVSFATMLVRTNDVFAAPSPRGIRLFDRKGKPRSVRRS